MNPRRRKRKRGLIRKIPPMPGEGNALPTPEYQWLNGTKSGDPSDHSGVPSQFKGFSMMDAIAWIKKNCKFAGWADINIQDPFQKEPEWTIYFKIEDDGYGSSHEEATVVKGETKELAVKKFLDQMLKQHYRYVKIIDVYPYL